MGNVVLVRHGETEWTLAGRHTGRTDVPLTEAGRSSARDVGALLHDRHFERVLTSPLIRALDTCRLAGFGDHAEVRDDLMEWDYGSYEGQTTADIRTEKPGWSLWRDGCPGGETAAMVGARADRVIGELRTVDGDALIFGHSHMLRVLAVRWTGLDATDGSRVVLDPAAVGVLGYERDTPVIVRWNINPRGGLT
jgi:broad specificity phosphatase PhoE